jgi:hypothetical protein
MAQRIYSDATTGELVIAPAGGGKERRFIKGSVNRKIYGDRVTITYVDGEIILRDDYTELTTIGDAVYASASALVTATDASFT